ncbi:hypothetical protein KXX25_000476, partial [Aspergillus fumigatus]
RSPNYPDTPTLQELGYSMVYDSPFGIAGPKGMDPKIVAKLHDAFKKAVEDPAVIATLAKYDMVPNYKNTEDYRKFVVELTESERKHRAVSENSNVRFRLNNSELWGGLIGLALGIFVLRSGLKLKLGTIHDPGSGFVLFYTGLLMCA